VNRNWVPIFEPKSNGGSKLALCGVYFRHRDFGSIGHGET
jgi:hypothetical protein